MVNGPTLAVGGPGYGRGVAVDPFARADESPDGEFYALPRLVVHLDPGAIAALTATYARLLPTDGEILDLMSSWRSHLPGPEALAGPRVVGLGMNADEMADNPRLAAHVVRDLNADPRLPFDDGRFAAAVCTVSVQYLTRPVEVFADLRRVLAPGAVAAVAFSDRCFPTKAIAAWRAGDDAEHVALVRAYLTRAGFADVAVEAPDSTDDPLFVVWGRA